MANHITHSSTMAETNSMMPDNRSATNVMPMGASQPPIWSVWMPEMSATKIIDAATTARTKKVIEAMLRCSPRRPPANKISPAASAGGWKHILV